MSIISVIGRIFGRAWGAREEVAAAVDDIQDLVSIAKRLAKKGDTGQELLEALDEIISLAVHVKNIASEK